MPAHSPSASSAVLSQIIRAEDMHNFIVQTVPEQLKLDSDEKTIFVALFSLAVEHHGAILNLLRTGRFNGSAAALARPLIDTIYRAMWLHCCGTPEHFAAVRAGGSPYPGLPNMADAIEKATPTSDTAFTALKTSILALHGFTHGGLEQLGRRFDTDGNVQATFTDGELSELVNVTTAYFVMMSVAWCQTYAGGDPTSEPRSQAITDGYNDRYGTYTG